MEKQDFCNYLQGISYPGRGILIGTSADGTKSVVVYFIMGRSENSRNRVFEQTPDGIRTVAHDPSKLEDPSLIIYHAVHHVGEQLIVTNGDQTDTIKKFMRNGETFQAALETREFEPDAPNYTPRISGLVKPDGSYTMSILKSDNGCPDRCIREYFDYENKPGEGRFISTYDGDGNPLPTFSGEPRPMEIPAADAVGPWFLEVWDSLDAENRVALYGWTRDLAEGDECEIIVNGREL